jgi:tagatose 6-phosphate kinase
MVKPNLEEAAEAVSFALGDEAAQWRAMDQFHAHGVTLSVISRGQEGALISRAGERLRVRPPAIREVNPVGSGDVFLAAFAIGIKEGWSLEKMARLGTALGAANAATWAIGQFDLEQVRVFEDAVQIERL